MPRHTLQRAERPRVSAAQLGSQLEGLLPLIGPLCRPGNFAVRLPELQKGRPPKALIHRRPQPILGLTARVVKPRGSGSADRQPVRTAPLSQHAHFRLARCGPDNGHKGPPSARNIMLRQFSPHSGCPRNIRLHTSSISQSSGGVPPEHRVLRCPPPTRLTTNMHATRDTATAMHMLQGWQVSKPQA